MFFCMTALCFSSCLNAKPEETLTKKVRRSLVFLDKHMSSTRRDIKHLKVPFGMCSSQWRKQRWKEKVIAMVRSSLHDPASTCRRGHPSSTEKQCQNENEQIVL